MKFEENRIYHIYNQGNNRQQIFFNHDNYLYFLRNYRKFVAPFCDTLAYCLMPNHFHFLINTTSKSVVERRVGSLVLTELSNGFRGLLSSYAAAINKQQNTTGSLFRQHTKAKLIESKTANYGFIALHYIHQNPLASNLVSNLSNWVYSSYKDYLGIRNGTLCDKNKAEKLLGLDLKNFENESAVMISNKMEISKIFL